MRPLTAYLLVFHGSFDPRSQRITSDLAHLLAQRIQYTKVEGSENAEIFGQTRSLFPTSTASASTDRDSITDPIPQPLVGTAALECASLPLHQQIQEFGQTLLTQFRGSGNELANGSVQIFILPLFLLAGVHVMEDIPAQVALAQRSLTPAIRLVIKPHLGSHPGLRRLITERMAKLPVEAWVLLSHGSRRPGANRAVEALADQLGALVAYWSVAPDLESRLSELADLGFRKVGVLPYFLFRGPTTDAIAKTVEQLSRKFPNLNLRLTDPLEASSELTDLLLNLAEDERI